MSHLRLVSFFLDNFFRKRGLQNERLIDVVVYSVLMEGIKKTSRFFQLDTTLINNKLWLRNQSIIFNLLIFIK